MFTTQSYIQQTLVTYFMVSSDIAKSLPVYVTVKNMQCGNILIQFPVTCMIKSNE